jgi:hypothetical protein
MPAFLEPYRMHIAFGLIVLAFLWPHVSPFVTGIIARVRAMRLPSSLGGIAAAPAMEDEDAKDYAALNRLAKRADRRNCPECKAAVKQFFAHWLDGVEA